MPDPFGQHRFVDLDQGQIPEARGQVVAQVFLVLVQRVALDAGQPVDMPAHPLRHGERFAFALPVWVGLDSMHAQDAVGTVGLHGGAECLGGNLSVESERGLTTLMTEQDNVGGGPVGAGTGPDGGHASGRFVVRE